jgi:mono/diheme cytochrome c family protein
MVLPMEISPTVSLVRRGLKVFIRTVGELSVASVFGFFLWAGASSFAVADDYLERVKPLLREKCYACHGVLKQEGGLRLETRDLMLTGGDSGPVIDLSDAEASLILERVRATDDSRMPPEGEGAKLKDEEIALIAEWIAAGGQAPAEPTPGGPEDHWAFQLPQKPVVDVETLHSLPESWTGNPIDQLLAIGHQQQKLVPVEVAEPRLLLRRLYLDLIGLPPTAAELAAFENNPTPEAYQEIVDRLLNSPQYGERWARHWMDIWRYSDWHGLGEQLRNSQKHIWQWRDWIIESLNRDAGYDVMIQDMLAADELAPDDLDRLRATGFLARQYYLFNRTTWLDDAIEHTSKAFLGMTMECAKCHSHKYDPIEHTDYYRFRAFFEPYQVRLDSVPGTTDLEKLALPRVFDAHPEAPTYVHIRGDEKKPDKDRVIQPGVPAALGGNPLQIEAIQLPPTAYKTSLRDYVIQDHINEAKKEIQIAAMDINRMHSLLADAESYEQRREAVAKRDRTKIRRFVLADDFSLLDDKLWQITGGPWEAIEGQIIQSGSMGDRSALQSLMLPPEDFEAVLDFTTTGGNMWRSVGIAFDMVDGREKMVYVSAVSPGGKVQVSYDQGSGASYPSEAAFAREVPLGTAQRLIVRVRGKLVNVAVDDRVVIAYQLPIERERGPLALITFDATAKFDRFLVRDLLEDETMVSPGEKGVSLPMTVTAAKSAAEVSRLKLEMLQLFPQAIVKAHNAEWAMLTSPDSEETKATVSDASAAFRAYELATAKWQLAVAVTDEQKKKASAEVERAEGAMAQPDGKFLEIRASLKSLEGPDETEESQKSPFPAISTGRRRALAQWIGSNENPLTARVGVNHIWLRHFGQPLVENVTDFGLRTAPPIQQSLLDFLAVEWMEHNWSMKHLHRLIVTSRAYQLSSSINQADPQTVSQDPTNQYYWRRLPQRMESQIIRDNLLAMAAALDLTVGGPPIALSASAESKRRSLYFRHSVDDHQEFLSMFDDADTLRCYRRTESVVPQQALALSNSREALQASREIAARISEQVGTGDDRLWVRAAFEHILAVVPNDAELEICLQGLDELRNQLGDRSPESAKQRSYETLVLALLNHNDFITIR